MTRPDLDSASPVKYSDRMLLPDLGLLERFWREHLDGRTGDGCYEWPGSRNDNGYGKLTLWRIGTWYTHRIAYGIVHGYVPVELDHLCRVRHCYRPDHLEVVTRRENLRRAGIAPHEQCERGHRFDEVGWYGNTKGRKCKACHRITARESARRRKAASVSVDPGQSLRAP